MDSAQGNSVDMRFAFLIEDDSDVAERRVRYIIRNVVLGKI